MDIAVGIRRTIMENISFVAPVLLLQALIYLVIFPELKHLGLFLAEISLHREVCLW